MSILRSVQHLQDQRVLSGDSTCYQEYIDMAKLSNQPLQPDPFITYRDPMTGQWIVEKTQTEKKKEKPVIPVAFATWPRLVKKSA